MTHTILREVTLERLQEGEMEFGNMPKCMQILGISILSHSFPLKKNEFIYLIEYIEGGLQFLSRIDEGENVVGFQTVFFKNCVAKPLEEVIKPISRSFEKGLVIQLNHHNSNATFSSAIGRVHVCLIEYFESINKLSINFKCIKELKLKYPTYGYKLNKDKQIQNILNGRFKSPSLICAEENQGIVKHASVDSSISLEEVVGHTVCGIPLENIEGDVHLWFKDFNIDMVDCPNCKYNYELLQRNLITST